MQNSNSANPNGVQFVSLLTSNQRKLFAYILSIVVNVNDADDIMQETVKTMWKKFADFEIGTDFLAWATTVAYYRILEFRKRKKRSQLVFDDHIFNELHQKAAAELQDTDEYLVYLKECMAKLTARDLRLVKMRYMNGLTVKDISSQFGRNLTSVYRSIARVQDLLRNCIKRQLSSEGLR